MSILQTIDLKKYYGTEPNITRALDGVNFSVNDGEFVAAAGGSHNGHKLAVLHGEIYAVKGAGNVRFWEPLVAASPPCFT